VRRAAGDAWIDWSSNGYRDRVCKTRAGTVELCIPELLQWLV
jgi:hypothetical protein